MAQFVVADRSLARPLRMRSTVTEDVDVNRDGRYRITHYGTTGEITVYLSHAEAVSLSVALREQISAREDRALRSQRSIRYLRRYP